MSEAERETTDGPVNFIEQIVREDLACGRIERVVTRFPPEPNGYLHIGHAKSICLNFGLAEKYGGICRLRFDDTNPETEEQRFVEAIQEDVRWLGFQWEGEPRYASDYFEQLYEWALYLIRAGKAYVCQLSPEEARAFRGTLTEPGRDSPYRNRSVEENLALFERMRRGEFEPGEAVLRAKIDMASPNMNLRDPVIYRVRKARHHRTGDRWCIYPSYDFAHGQSDAIEGVTHSLCTLEFEDHRPLYDWFLDNLPVPSRPRQYEFARLNLNYTVTSKRKLKRLVEEGHVTGWDDPRMPTLAGLRRRGVPPEAIRAFCARLGVTRAEGVVDVSMLEHAIREHLEPRAPRRMCVLDPIKLVLTNYPAGRRETLTAPGHPKRDDLPPRPLPFGRELYIDRADFLEAPPKGYKRLSPGARVRLRYGYVIEAEDCVKDEAGRIVEVRARYLPETLGAEPSDGGRPRGVIHWVSAAEHVECEVRLYDRLFKDPFPGGDGRDFIESLNPDSLVVRRGCKGEPALAEATAADRFQFEREGYFCLDPAAGGPGRLVFNRVIALRDGWAKQARRG